MIDNICKKLTILSVIIFFIEAFFFLLAGHIIFVEYYELYLAIPVSVLGVCFAGINSWFVYIFGKLIEKNTNGLASMRGNHQQPENNPPKNPQ